MYKNHQGILWLAVWLLAIPATATTIYKVKTTSEGAANGNGWDNACTLQYALSHASGSTADQIWVAMGTTTVPTYKPTTGADRSVSFSLPSGVEIYGGFLGLTSETSLTQRNPEVNETILDGNIGDPDDATDNSYHVVTVTAGTYVSTKLSGFTISNGFANGEFDSFGGGILITHGAETVTGVSLNRLLIRNNFAETGGGGLFLSGGSSQVPTYLANCRFEGNSADTGWGGGMLVDGGSVGNLQNCIFFGNACGGGYGGAIAVLTGVTRGWVIATNCTFNSNSAIVGGGLYTQPRFPGTGPVPISIRNGILWGDAANIGPEAYADDLGDIYMQYTDVDDSYWFGSNENQQADPLFRDPSTGNLRVQYCSTTIDAGADQDRMYDYTDVDDSGGDPLVFITWDIRKRPRVINFDGAGSMYLQIDLGAYEESCFGDISGDGAVSITDLTMLLSHFGTAPCTGDLCYLDLDCDGDVDIGDLTLLLAHFGNICSMSLFEDGMSQASDDTQDPMDAWIQSATPEEVLAWWYNGMPWPP